MKAALQVGILSPHEVTRAGLSTIFADYDIALLAWVDAPLVEEALVDIDVLLYEAASNCREQDYWQLAWLAGTGAKVVLITHRDAEDRLTSEVTQSATGVVACSATAEEFRAEVERVADLPRPIVHEVVRPGGLSPQEVKALRLIAAGHTNDEIADTMFVSINTVKTYIRSAYRKIGVKSRSQAVGWALSHGFSHNSPPTCDGLGGRALPV